MENFREKNYYRDKIIEMVEGIENPEILEYLYIFIQGKMDGHVNEEERE